MSSKTTTFVLLNILFVEGWVRQTFPQKTEVICLLYFQRPYSLNFQNFSYAVPQPEILDYNLTFVTVQDTQHFNANIHIPKEIPVAYAHLLIRMNSDSDTYDLVYLNRTFSVCKFLQKDKINPLIGILHRVLSNAMELPKRCPIPKVK